MDPNPVLGVSLHWLGGLASGSFYVFYRKVRGWSWETYWLTGGFFAWLLMPWAFAFGLTEDLLGVLARAEVRTLLLSFGFGAIWGLGGLTAGLSIRFLGMSLGQGVTLGFCAAFGTLVPPWVQGTMGIIASSVSGQVTLLGIGICMVGIAIAAAAGLSKEREMPVETKKATVKEFNFLKGMIVASLAGILSAFFAFGLEAAAPLSHLSAAAGTETMWTGLPKIVVVLLGGFCTNVICCVGLNIRKGTIKEYLSTPSGERVGVSRTFPLRNYLACAAAGTTWYLQFFFYTMGETQMGQFQFSSWTLHMASIIIFSTMWGWILREWKGASRRTHAIIGSGIAVLILSTLVVGYGNYLGTLTK